MRLIDADALTVDYIVPSASTGTTNTRYVSLYQIINAPTVQPMDVQEAYYRGKIDGIKECMTRLNKKMNEEVAK